jgi:hypothetical protein
MRTFWSTLVVPGLLLTGICVTPTTALAELKTFTIDSTQSSLTLSGSLQGFPIDQQGPGSLTAYYKGTIIADVTDTTITFVGGSLITAITNGVWSPNTNGVAGTAPANYGGSLNAGIITGTAAFRALVYDATSGALPITAGSFSALGMTFSFPPSASSVLDYRYTVFTSTTGGHKALAGNSTNNIISSGSVSNLAGNLVLTIPVDFTNSSTLGSAGSLQYHLQGQFVAVVAAVAAPLKISAFQLNAGQLNFTIGTISNQSYTILGSTNLPDWSITNDQFTATNTSTTRTIPLPALPREFFRVRQN